MNTLLINIVVALVMSMIISFVYYFAHQKQLKDDMFLTLLLLPIVVTTIIYTIGTNVAGAFSLAGIFTLVRFRSTQASPKDITYILLGVAAGLTSAASYYLEGILVISVIGVVILIYEVVTKKRNKYTLKVLLPEELTDGEEINKVLNKYTKGFSLENIQTKDLGSLFEYAYKINISNKINVKEMIDELRVVNGNLTIKLTDQ